MSYQSDLLVSACLLPLVLRRWRSKPLHLCGSVLVISIFIGHYLLDEALHQWSAIAGVILMCGLFWWDRKK